jgi:outer membrane protein insertion porin family
MFQHTGPRLALLVGLLALLHASVSRADEPPLIPTYVLEDIQIRGNTKTKSSIIRRELRVQPGERLSVEDPRFDLSRYRVLSLGYFSDVRLKLEKGSSRGKVILVVQVVERGTIILTDLFLGTSEATKAWGGLGVAETNFLGRGITLDGAFVLGASPEVEQGDLQQAYRLRASTRRLWKLPLSLSGSFNFLDGNDFFRQSGPQSSSDPKDFVSLRYRRIGGTLGIGFDLARYTRMFVDYRGEAVRSYLPSVRLRQDPSGFSEPIKFNIINGDSVLSLLAITVERDTRSDPVLPQRGNLITINGQVSSEVFGSGYDYFKLAARWDSFFPVRWGHVVSVQARGGVIFGEAPFFEKFFIGDFNDLIPGRALGLNFSTLPSRNIFGTSINAKRYEEFAIRLSGEYIIPWFRGGRRLYGGDFFLNVGFIMLTSRTELRIRDRSLAQSIPVDLTIDAGLRLDTQIGIFRFSIGNALGRIPF